MLIHARWRKLTNALLAAYDDQFVQKWKRILKKLESHSKQGFQLRSFDKLGAKTVAKLIREEQANIKRQTLVNIKNWKTLIGGIKKKLAKRAKIQKLVVMGRWRILSQSILDLHRAKVEEGIVEPENKALKNWVLLVKKLSMRKYGGFHVMLNEVIDVGFRIISMKINVKRLKKRRLIIFGKWN